MAAERPQVDYIEDVEKPVDYKYYIFLFQKNFYVILTFFLITITLASIYAAKIPERFRSTAQLLIERPKGASWRQPLSGEDPETVGWAEDYYNTQMEIMRSLAVMREVARDLKLTQYFGTDNLDHAANIAMNMVSVNRIRRSRLFNVQAETRDPQFSTDLANATARAYIRVNFENQLYFTQEILGWIPQEGDMDDVITIEDPLGGARQMTRRELIESLPAIRTDPTLQSLRGKLAEAEAELQLLLKQYREKHPLMIRARSNLKFLQESIDAEKARIIETLKTEAEGRHQIAFARVIEEAQVPKTSIPVNRIKIVLIIGVAELFLSFLIIFLIDFFDDTIRSVEDLERRGLMLAFLGPIPKIVDNQTSKNEKNIAGYHEKRSKAAESFRYLRVAINFSASPESIKTLVVTSCLPHEGKSFISHNLAISLAMDGNKTLLVDGDLRRPVLHKIFRVDNSTGLSNYLTSNLDFESIVKETFVENLFVVASGPISPNPGEILGSKRMREFLKDTHDRYDRVIIDCPPLTGIGDGFVIGSMIGHVIMVISAGKTPGELIKRIQDQLDKAGIKVIGVVLNNVDMEKERYGGYYKYYYHTYNRYYANYDEH